MSEQTKKVRRAYRFLWFLHVGLPIIASVVLLIVGWITGDPVHKLSLSACIIAAIIFAAINLIRKVRLTCIPFLVILGVYMCLGNILVIIFSFAIYTILDDFIFAPQFDKMKTSYIANKQMDKRGL